MKAALKEGAGIDRIYIDKETRQAWAAEIRKEASDRGVPIQYVPAQKLTSFNAGEHGGCIALRSKVNYIELQDLISFTTESGEPPLFLILDGITDVRNIGGIARTAYCCGVHGIIIPDRGVGALNEDAILTSAGALEHLPICRVSSLLKAVDELHMNGIKVLGSQMAAPQTLDSTDLSIPLAIILGSEDKGIYPALLKACDETFSIPMKNDFESLNVSVANGMILYETMKQRKA